METLTSLKNPRVALWRSLKDRKARKETGLFLVEGRKMVAEALASRFDVETVLCDAAQTEAFAPLLNQCETVLLPEHVLAAVCDTKTPQGIAAVVRMHTETRQGPRLVALDGVQDPGNVGTIWRTADAAGFGGLLLGANCADPYSPKVQRAAMAAFAWACRLLPDLHPLCEAHLREQRLDGARLGARRRGLLPKTRSGGALRARHRQRSATASRKMCARRPTRWSSSPCAAAPNRSTRRWRRAS